MDKFLELVSKVKGLNVGDDSRSSSRRPSISSGSNVTEQLPLTSKFISTLPRNIVLSQAARNDAKPEEAHDLIQRVDNLVQSHATAARELKQYVAELSTMKANIASSTAQAQDIFNQLSDIETTLASSEEVDIRREIEELQRGEDAKFEKYAKSRRAELAKKRRDHAMQLAAFERERMGVLASTREETGLQLKPKQLAKMAAKTRNISLDMGMGMGEAARSSRESLVGEDDLDTFLGDDGDDDDQPAHRVKGTETTTQTKSGRTKSSPAVIAGRHAAMARKVVETTATRARPPARKQVLDIMDDEDFDEEDETKPVRKKNR